jgi:hypothetical protein
MVILDGNQKTLRSLDWLNNVFEEPYIHDFAAGNLDAWMGKAGFEAVQTDDLWLVNQVTQGVKALQETGDRKQETGEDTFLGEDWVTAPGY